MDAGIFAALYNGIGPPIITASNGVVAALQGWMRPILIAGLILYAVGKNIFAALGGGKETLTDTLGLMIVGSVFIYAATEAAGLGPQARDLLLRGLSNEIGRVVLGAISGQQVGANLFDDTAGRAWGAGLAAYNKLPTWSMKAWALAVIIAFYWAVALFCVAVAFFIWLTSFVMVALLVGFWPIGVGLFAFPWTRGFAWGWLRSTISNVLLQVLLMGVLTILFGALIRVLTTVAAAPNTGGVNEVAQVGRLLASSVIFGLLAWVAKQLPALAATWAHGFTGFGQTAIIQMPSWVPVLGGSGGSHGGGGAIGASHPGTVPGGPMPLAPAMPNATPPGRALG